MNGSHIRCDKEFRSILAQIKLDAIKRGIPIPSSEKITKMIANKLKKEGIIQYDKFIQFK